MMLFMKRVLFGVFNRHLSHQPTYPNGECKEMGGDPLSSVGTCSRKAAPVVRRRYLDGLPNPSPAARRGAEGAPLSYLEQSEK